MSHKNTFYNQLHSDFTQVPNYVLQDPRLDWRAKGVLAYLCSRPSWWKFYLTEIETNAKDGIKSLKSALRQLEDTGYLIRKPIRDGHGIFRGLEWIIQHSEEGKKLHSEQSEPEVPLTASGSAASGQAAGGERHANNTDSNNTDDINPNNIEEPAQKPKLKGDDKYVDQFIKQAMDKPFHERTEDEIHMIIVDDICQQLYQAVKNWDENHVFNKRKPAMKTWRKEVSRAMRKDGRTEAQLKGLINFIYINPETTHTEIALFWAGNICSGSTLRSKFQKVKDQVRREAAKHKSKPGNKADQHYAGIS